ncbi:nucleolar complex protein 2 [Tanacetum coccineum]
MNAFIPDECIWLGSDSKRCMHTDWFRLCCIRMLNQIASATNTFIPVVVVLTDMLDIKEFHKLPSGGVGNVVDLRTILKLSFVPAVRLRNFRKSTKVDRFRREMRQFIREIEANCPMTLEFKFSGLMVVGNGGVFTLQGLGSTFATSFSILIPNVVKALPSRRSKGTTTVIERH